MNIGAPWSAIDRRRTVKAPVNPLDKSTVVSIYPRYIEETKVTLQPSKFILQPGTYEHPSILVVGPSSWWRDIEVESPLLEIPVSSIQIADSIVRDYCNGMFGCDMGGKMPGLFYVQGAKTVEIIKKEFRKELDEANEKQRAWFNELVNQADVDWARTSGNPLSVSDLSRLACKELQIKEKAWMANITAMEMVNCKACGTMIRPGYPVCAHCGHVIDAKLYESMGLKKVV